MSLEKKIKKMYMTAVAAIYVMFIVGGGVILLDVMMQVYDVKMGIIPVITGLAILSILFAYYLTLLRKRMFSLFTDSIGTAEGVLMSDLDDPNNYGG